MRKITEFKRENSSGKTNHKLERKLNNTIKLNF